MDLTILASALIGLGIYCHYLLSRINELLEENGSLHDTMMTMMKELAELGSPNVMYFRKEPDEKTKTPP
jgi:hypothetical protein